MFTHADILDAQTAGLAELERACADLEDARPAADGLDDAQRSARARDLRLDFAQNWHLGTRGRRLTFEHPWLLPIYRDESRSKAIKKCVQEGISEYLVVYSIADAAAGRTVFYALPTERVRNRFVAQRVDRPLLLVDRYRSLMLASIGGTDNRAFKQIGAGAVYFLGSNAPQEFIEISADTTIVDEVDRCNDENLAMVPDRLQYSAWPVSILSGNPTLPEYGISLAYENSDQRVWQVKCRACGTWQGIDFFVNVLRVDRDDAGEIVRTERLDRKWTPQMERDVHCYCARCGAVIDRLESDPKHCAWIARYPGRAVTGWHISKLMSRRVAMIDEVVTSNGQPLSVLAGAWDAAQGNTAKTERFVNNLLGLEYTPAGAAVTDAMLNALCRDFDLPQASANPCTMGIDVGKLWDVRISDCPEPGVRRARLIGRFDGPARCLELMSRYNVRSCVIDAQPEIRLAESFQKAAQERFGRPGGRRIVWRCEFSADDSVKTVLKDAKSGVVRVNRTVAFDDAMDDVRNGKNWLPRAASGLLKGEYYAQMKVPKRKRVEKPDGDAFIWTKGVDHQRLADVYDKLASVIAPKALAVLSGSLCARTGGDRVLLETDN